MRDWDTEASLPQLIAGMKNAHEAGHNSMAYARSVLGADSNSRLATALSYDLQAGSYISWSEENGEMHAKWCDQVASVLTSVLPQEASLLEVGLGDGTTLEGVLSRASERIASALGFDISWSRCYVASHYLAKRSQPARVFAADLFSIPLSDSAVDVVYTSHSLEPNGGREIDAIDELLRVARVAVVLIEPLYELADSRAQERMRTHGYVRGLAAAAERCGATVQRHELLPFSKNPLNPSGVVVLAKTPSPEAPSTSWQCPVTRAALTDEGDCYYAEHTGIAYPVVRGIPLLTPESAFFANRLHRAPRP